MNPSKKSNEPTTHVLLKYSEKSAPSPGTIELHNQIIKKKGSVWIGKFGKPTGMPMINKLLKQIKKKKPAYLFMSKHTGGGTYELHAGVLLDVSRKLDDLSTVPTYYADKYRYVRTWFKVKEFVKLEPEILRILRGKSSMLPIILSLKKSMAAMIYVILGGDVDLKKYEIKKKGKKD